MGFDNDWKAYEGEKVAMWDTHVSAREVAKGGAIRVPSRLTDALALSPRTPAAPPVAKPRPSASDCLSPRGGNFHLAEAERLCTTTSLVHPWKDHRDIEKIMASTSPFNPYPDPGPNPDPDPDPNPNPNPSPNPNPNPNQASTSPHQRSTSLHHVVGFTEPERVEAAVRRQARYAEQIQSKLELRQAKEEQLEAGCERQRKAVSQRCAGFLLLKESSLAAKGTGRAAGLEPPSAPDWKAAPSSHTSHWATIGAQHSDPPVGVRSTSTGVPTQMVTSYRRSA